MNVVLYKLISFKKINGTLFYCFEYYSLLKKYIPDIKFIIFDKEEKDLNFIKNVFKDKYNTNQIELDDIVLINKYTDLYHFNLENVLTLDVRTFSDLSIFIKDSTFLSYSNDEHNFLNKNNVTFYGWYDYQNFNKKTRLKIYKEIHKTFNEKGNKIFISSLGGDNKEIAKKLNLNLDNVLLKLPNKHNENLFKNINKVIYWHTGQRDTNNRILIETQIHNIELEVHLNGILDDSIYIRSEDIKNKNINDYFLTEDDILIKDFIKQCYYQ